MGSFWILSTSVRTACLDKAKQNKTRQSKQSEEFPLNLPAKTAYTLTYKATNPAEVWESTIRLFTKRRMFILNTIGCIFVALAVPCSLSLPFSLVTFLGILIATVFFQFFWFIGCAFLYTASIVFLSKLDVESTTIIDEDGISDSLGPVKLKYKWHQIRDVEMKNGNIYVISLFNGMYIPSCAFASSEEAEEVFALAKKYKTAAQQKKNQIAAGSDTHVQDPVLLLKSLQDEEEAKWLEIENKHKEQNREN